MTFESLESQDLEQAHSPDQPVEVPPPPRASLFRRENITRENVIAGLLLALILVAGTYFRFTGQNWDDYTHLHPDERHMSDVTGRIGGPLETITDEPAKSQQIQQCLARYPNSQGVADSIFDSLCSTWYPLNVGKDYFYGELPLFIVKFATQWTASISGNPAWLGYNADQLVGRSVSAIADLISLFFLFLIGRRLYNKWIGLLAAALYAAAVFPIQLSHYWTTDAFTNLPVLIAFWFAIRAMDRSQWYDFAGFGISMGAALASKINTLPLFGIIVLAAIVYTLPAFDMSLPGSERWRLIGRAIGGCVIAFLLTIFTFRITNPHAFTGGPGLLGFFNILPYGPWLTELRKSAEFAAGIYDFPPNHQWASRTPYLFPLRNMVLWGMGLPLGLISWFGWVWAGVQILRARPNWTRHILPVTWILVYFGYVGRQWVMTMRYYINLYPFLILLGAWALYEIAVRSARWARANPTTARRLAMAGGALLLVGVVLATYLWAQMFVKIYQRQLTRVEATRWVQRNFPSGFATSVTAPDGKWRLINLDMSGGPQFNITQYQPGQRQVAPVVQPVGYVTDRVVVNHLADPERGAQPKRFSVALAADPDGNDILAQGTIEDNFALQGQPFGATYTVMLDQAAMLTPMQPYYLVSWSNGRLNIARNQTGDPDFLLSDSQGNRVGAASLPVAQQNMEAAVSLGSTPVRAAFSAPIAGSIDQVAITHLLNPLNDGSLTDLTVRILDPQNGKALAEGHLSADANSTERSPYGNPFTIKLNEAIQAEANQKFILEASSAAPAQVAGTVIAWEGDWDDPIPWSVCPIPADMELTHDTPSGINPLECNAISGLGTWYKDTKLQMAAEDDQTKRRTIQAGLDQADYYIISSNRFYDSLSRMPMRFPMTIAFYNALFNNQLGFALDKLVTSYPSIGNFEIADQNLPIYGSPSWVNEWESEEAFSVYDHPTVFIYKKTPAYSPQVLASVLNIPLTEANGVGINTEGTPDTTLINRITWNPTQSTAAPTGFQLTPEQRVIQTQGGTWSDLFNRDWTINTSPLVAVVVWWLAIMLIGFAVWPILFVILPGLPDRGYPLTKIAGLLIVSWIVWVGGTLHLLTWSQPGIALTLLALIVVGLLFARARRTELIDYMRLNWRHLVIVELITFILFMAFLFVRLGNPDLWAQVLGGEKPMDFAYFNGVLRSTIFPPYDPWYAGGYLNYYYFGYVLVGTPVRLLGIMPEIAYNLILPMLFAMTGIGAFSFAFNVVASRWFSPRDEGDENGESTQARRRFALHVPRANPYLAGVLALLLCVVLGNLDEPRVFFMGVARAGGYDAEAADMFNWKVQEFVRQNHRQPTQEESAKLTLDAAKPGLGDQIAFGLYSAQRFITGFTNGVGQTLGGGPLPISPDRWFWAPTRIVGELPNANNEIQEMPAFTFIYADLHAHMMALPLTLLALGWLLAEILAAGVIERRTWVAILATGFGGLAVGILQPTNTWDWFTYLLLALVGLTFAMFLRRKRFGRRTLLQWIAQVGWFFGAQAIVALPFTAFWATSYVSGNALKSFDGNKTPIWAYLDIHGLFLFAIVSLLIWQTARLLRRLYVRDFVGRAWPLIALMFVIGLTIFVTLFLVLVPGQFWLVNTPIPLALICVPLMVWCGVLFLVPDQSREMRVLLALSGLALSVTFGVEIIVLGADIGRQNTFFKFYMQAWILFSVVSGVALAWLIHESGRWRTVLGVPWLGVLAVLLAVAALFPIMATEGKVAMRMASQAPHTLDGEAYMDYATYYEGATPIPLTAELGIIRWLEDNVKGSPVVLEGYMSEYKLGARIAINTGLPTVIGWRWHQAQQRTIDPLPNLIWERIANVAAMYDLTDIGAVWKMLKYYNVEYIVVSKMEQTVYQPAGLAKFDEMVSRGLLEVVYKKDYQEPDPEAKDVGATKTVTNRIYHVVPGATYADMQVGGQ